ncbi:MULTISPECIES: glycerophosphodiester phosphodiesterase family protein [unclassified Iodidimonas]|jgi:glycerophosphoryl diester phosphodiesterase|uniref:glycerophosphodiester phosphodiesterase family protein n=1 Tax=unclassified Iodidimonas TaxID=2626145 RepID=UPI002482FBBE|nr:MULTISPECIES: glycerophosphodiester phosphodiesterase family protein [unclassified Iodidimonas]
MFRLIVMGIFLMSASPALSWPYPTLSGERPVVIAHRGASGYLPEHTLEGYKLAMEMGADFIEPDLVLTKDGVLIARHDYYLSGSTDIADHPEFADRRKTLDGRADWYVEDFTLAEIKTLRARQAFPGRSKAFDDRFEIPTFDEILTLVADHEAAGGKQIGVYPETKHPEHFKSIGLDFIAPLLQSLTRHGYVDESAPVFIQSFEPGILRDLKNQSTLRRIMLVFPKSEIDPEADSLTPSVSLAQAADFAHGVGPSKTLLIDADGKDTGFVQRAHQLGLLVHPWTLRDDQLLPLFESPAQEYEAILGLGVDGFFTDFANRGVLMRGLLGLEKTQP